MMASLALPAHHVSHLGLDGHTLKHILALKEKLDSGSGTMGKKHAKDSMGFSEILAVRSSSSELEMYSTLTQALAPHCNGPVCFGSAGIDDHFYPVRIKLGESARLLFVDVRFTYQDAVQVLSSGTSLTGPSSGAQPLQVVHSPSSAQARCTAPSSGAIVSVGSGSVGYPNAAAFALLSEAKHTYAIADASCFRGIFGVGEEFAGSLVFGAVAAAAATTMPINFPLTVDIGAAEQMVYVGCRPSELRLYDISPFFECLGFNAVLPFPDDTRQHRGSHFGERITAPVRPGLPTDVQSSAGVDDGFSMRVHVPASCVYRETTVSVCFPKLAADMSPKNWILQPFRICFGDGSQPLQPIQIYATTPRDVKFERLELFKWSEADFEPPIELLRRKPGRNGQQLATAYFALDEPSSIYAEINHLSVFQFHLGQRAVEFDAESIDEAHPFSRGYSDERENRCTSFRRGAERYALPAYFRRIALNVGDFSKYENWPVAFHGTPDLQHAKAIIQRGFRLPESVRPGHIPLGRPYRGFRNFARAVFLSPSHKYSMQYGQLIIPSSSATTGTSGRTYVRTGTVTAEDEVVFVLIQCRVRPRSYLKIASTTSGWSHADPRVPDSEIEYRLEVPQDAKPYGLLMRAVPRAEVRRMLQDRSSL